MAKKKAMDLSIGSTDYVALEDSKFSTSSNDENKSEQLEKTTPTTFTLPVVDVALLKAVAFQRSTERGGKASASAVLQELLREHRKALFEEADEYMFMSVVKQMTKDLPGEEQIKASLSAKVASL